MTPIDDAAPHNVLAPPGARLSLLPGCAVTVDGMEVHVPSRAQRLLALLATARHQWVSRAVVAGTLWPEVTDARAFSSLRSTLRELSASRCGVVDIDADVLRISPAVRVDWLRAEHIAHKILTGKSPALTKEPMPLLRYPLLARWSEEWLIEEQYAFDQLRVHALEALCRSLTADRKYAHAVEAGLRAVACQPLRESAQVALISAHLAEGNRFVALEQYRRYERTLAEELGIRPGPRLRELLELR